MKSNATILENLKYYQLDNYVYIFPSMEIYLFDYKDVNKEINQLLEHYSNEYKNTLDKLHEDNIKGRRFWISINTWKRKDNNDVYYWDWNLTFGLNQYIFTTSVGKVYKMPLYTTLDDLDFTQVKSMLDQSIYAVLFNLNTIKINIILISIKLQINKWIEHTKFNFSQEMCNHCITNHKKVNSRKCKQKDIYRYISNITDENLIKPLPSTTDRKFFKSI